SGSNLSLASVKFLASASILVSPSPLQGWSGDTGARCARASPALCRLISKTVLKTKRNFQNLPFSGRVRCAERTNAALSRVEPTRKTDPASVFRWCRSAVVWECLQHSEFMGLGFLEFLSNLG